MVQKNGDFENDVKNWIIMNGASGILSDEILLRLKSSFYKTIMNPIIWIGHIMPSIRQWIIKQKRVKILR